MEGIKITSFNVNCVHNPIKRGKILSKLKKCNNTCEKTHVALLQETHLNATEHAKLGRLGFKHVFSSSHVSGNKRGVAILIQSTVNYEHILDKKDKEGRYVLIKGKLDSSLVSLLNVYSFPNGDWSFYKRIFDIMTSDAEGVLICGGDLNVRLNDKLDSSGTGTSQTKINKKVNTDARDRNH